MPEMPRNQQQRERQGQAREKPRAFERPPAPKTRTAGEQAKGFVLDAPGDVKAAPKSAMKIAETKATAGRAGESNLAIEWIDVWIGNWKPCRFDVRTLPGNALEVLVEQLAYKKSYTGSTALSTMPVPIAEPGTPLKVTARDTTTGEVLEQTGYWYRMGASGFLTRLWQTIKHLVWKAEGG